jgi:hypothetical protein
MTSSVGKSGKVKGPKSRCFPLLHPVRVGTSAGRSTRKYTDSASSGRSHSCTLPRATGGNCLEPKETLPPWGPTAGGSKIIATRTSPRRVPSAAWTTKRCCIKRSRRSMVPTSIGEPRLASASSSVPSRNRSGREPAETSTPVSCPSTAWEKLPWLSNCTQRFRASPSLRTDVT